MLGNIAALVAGGLVVFLEIWTIVPAPTLPTLVVAAVLPELTPWSIIFCLLAAAFSNAVARGWARNFGVFTSAFGLGCALVPWCLLSGTIARCEDEMKLAFGDTGQAESNRHIPGAPDRPYSVETAFTGYAPLRAPFVRHDLPVRLRDGDRLALDVYGPADGKLRPTIVIIYGGAWIFGSRADSAQLARSFAGLGYTAIAVDYRHAPRYRFPTQIDDVRDALAAIAHNAVAWDVDPSRVAILGRSAGAQLALLAAYTPEPLTVRAAIAYYAPTDLVAGYRFPPRPDPTDVDRILRAYLGGTPTDQPAAYIAASPIRHVAPGVPPTLLIGGGRDELVRLSFAHQLRTALRRHGARVAALDIPWSNHAFDEIANGTGGQIARYYTDRFLAAVFKN